MKNSSAMNKEITALQELISDMKNFKTFPLCTDNDRHAIDACIGFAENKLEKEKQQIKSAYDDGQNTEFSSPEVYFNQIFKQ